ncbi:MAG: hypothetical protein R3337_01945 [Gammaproteobacteria bacterium]|nr:hypothetical protein [Gammaproteobacteria bacterium]
MNWLRHGAILSAGAILIVSSVFEVSFAASEACPGNMPSTQLLAEDEVLRCHLSPARSGDAVSIEAIVRLAGGDYINSAEGGEFLNATYMELLIAHPRTFLPVVNRQDRAIKERVIRELKQPVHDAYTSGDLLAAVRLAARHGVRSASFADLERIYSQSSRGEHETDRQRKALQAAAERCLSSRPIESECSDATSIARDSLRLSPHDPVIAAIAIELADFVGESRAEGIFRKDYFRRSACNAAAFFHHAMAQYERYGARSRDAVDRVCARETASR